ncbi:MAG: endo-1,4-beta-xylanase [Prevotella sp.]|nr:endo-1,4-beta-xylanase [Prevotella sp.]
MNKIFRNGLMMLVAGTLAVSCADYNVTDEFSAQPDPTYVTPYSDLAPVKSYINREQYPNLSLGTTLKVSDFNKQDLAHSAAVTNFDNVAFGTSLMSGTIINDKGVMNFLDMSDLLSHVEEIGYEVYGSPLFANANQADGWLKVLTAPIEIPVDPIEDVTVDYTTMEEFTGTAEGTKPVIVKNYDGNENALKVPKSRRGKTRIVEGFDIDPLGTYTITFNAKVDDEVNLVCTFADNKIQDGGSDKKFQIKAGKWQKVVIEAMPAEGATEGYLMIEGNMNSDVYIKTVQVVHFPDNHRPQTEQERNDTIDYAINAWCEGLMKINAGRINMFDLIDEPLDTKAVLDNGMFDIKHSTDLIFWQDVLGSENYAPAVSRAASAAYQKYEGDPAQLRFFISESGLDDSQKMASLNYWIQIWDSKGAKIDGINAKLNLAYSEDPEKQAANVASLENLLSNLAASGKLVRLSNFDIKYLDASGLNVSAKDITEEQRQKLADYYGFVIKSYMNKIPHDKQAGLCKGSMVDTSDPVGLWAIDSNTKDWVRTATYKAFCDALSGK